MAPSGTPGQRHATDYEVITVLLVCLFILVIPNIQCLFNECYNLPFEIRHFLMISVRQVVLFDN